MMVFEWGDTDTTQPLFFMPIGFWFPGHISSSSLPWFT